MTPKVDPNKPVKEDPTFPEIMRSTFRVLDEKIDYKMVLSDFFDLMDQAVKLAKKNKAKA